jgi:hypothetical protein
MVAMQCAGELYKMLAENYQLWIYNGQDDGCIPYVGAQEWTSRESGHDTQAITFGISHVMSYFMYCDVMYCDVRPGLS